MWFGIEGDWTGWTNSSVIQSEKWDDSKGSESLQLPPATPPKELVDFLNSLVFLGPIFNPFSLFSYDLDVM